MAMEGAATNSEDYAIRFGGIWLEFHERIVTAETNLTAALAERDAVRAERDSIHSHKIELEEKFKRSIASLTRTETDHLEARQIFDKVREEHADLSRRYLAAEAHTEWLEDKLKQLKASYKIKEDEVQAIKFRADLQKAAVSDRECVIDGLQRVIAARDAEIASCCNTIRARDEELLVLTRSAHSKDKQNALLVKERNTLQEDLQKTQRSLALLRRTESSVKRKAAVEKSAVEESTPVHVRTPQRPASSHQTRSALRDESMSTPMVIASPEKSQAVTSHTPRAASTPAPATSMVGSVLRKYKASRAQGSVGGRSAASAAQEDCSSSVLLDDILQSVLDEPAAVPGALSSSTSNSVPTAASITNAAHIAVGQTENSSGIGSAVELLLDDADLDFISSVLDQSSEQCTPIPAVVVTPVCAQSKARRRILSTAASHIVAGAAGLSGFDATVQKMLFGDASPLPTRSAPAASYCTAATAIATTTTPVRGADSAVVIDTTPATAIVTLTPNSDASAVTVDNCLAVVETGNSAPSAARELAASLSREKDYKAALYLLQEEVRHLRAQVAQHDAAKRAIRLNTPKGAAARKKTSLVHTPVSANVSAAEKPGGCVRKLLFPAHA